MCDVLFWLAENEYWPNSTLGSCNHWSEVVLHQERKFGTVRSGQDDKKITQKVEEEKLSDHLVTGFKAGWSVTLSDFYSVGISGPWQSARRPREVIYFLKAIWPRPFHLTKYISTYLRLVLSTSLIEHPGDPRETCALSDICSCFKMFHP